MTRSHDHCQGRPSFDPSFRCPSLKPFSSGDQFPFKWPAPGCRCPLGGVISGHRPYKHLLTVLKFQTMVHWGWVLNSVSLGWGVAIFLEGGASLHLVDCYILPLPPTDKKTLLHRCWAAAIVLGILSIISITLLLICRRKCQSSLQLWHSIHAHN